MRKHFCYKRKEPKTSVSLKLQRAREQLAIYISEFFSTKPFRVLIDYPNLLAHSSLSFQVH